MLIYQNLGTNFCALKSNYRSQKCSALPPGSPYHDWLGRPGPNWLNKDFSHYISHIIFVTLPWEIPDKMKFHPWKFQKIVLHPLEIPRPKNGNGNSTWFFLSPLKILSSSFLNDLRNFHILLSSGVNSISGAISGTNSSPLYSYLFWCLQTRFLPHTYLKVSAWVS